MFTGPDIVTDGLVLALDAANVKSYPGSGTTWNNIAGSNNGTLTNGPTFSGSNNGIITFDGVDDYVSISETDLTDWSISSWFYYDYNPLNTQIFYLPMSSGNKSGQIYWSRSLFFGITSISFDSTGSIYFGTFGNGIWDGTYERFFAGKIDSTGSLVTEFDIGYSVGGAKNQTGTYIGNDGYLYTSGTNLNFFAKRNKQTGALISQASSGATTISATFIIDEDNRKVYHMGGYTSAFGEARKYICKFDLDTYELDTVFDTSNGLNTIPAGITLTSDNQYLYAFGQNLSSYKGTSINHIVKLDQSGSLDPNFNPGVGFNDARGIKCRIDSQDRLVCVGRYFTSYSGSACTRIVRINPDGTKDDTFNIGTGLNMIRVGDLDIQSDDKVLVTGYFTSYSGSASRGIARINADGTYDTTFDIGTGIQDLNNIPNLAIQPDGKILLINSQNIDGEYNGTTYKTFLRLDNSGSVDPTFITGSGFTDSISRAQITTRIKNTAGSLTSNIDYYSFPSFGGRREPQLYKDRLNGWNNITYTKDETNTLSMYLNGELVDTITYNTSSYQNLSLEIDQLVTSKNEVASIYIYDKVLTPDEILVNYNAQKARFNL